MTVWMIAGLVVVALLSIYAPRLAGMLVILLVAVLAIRSAQKGLL